MLLLVWLGPAQARDYEYLEFEIGYTGSFSSNKEIKVAKAVWSSKPAVVQEDSDLSLRISSEGYSKLESMFPFRLCHQSDYSPKQRRTLGFNTFIRAGRELESLKVRFDWPAMLLRREKAEAELHNNRSDPFDLMGGVVRTDIKWQRNSSKDKVSKLMLDRISMLQHLRKMRLNQGLVVNVPVTDGERELEYWASISEEDLPGIMGKSWPSYRINFETFDLHPKKDRPIHPPVDVWISRDNRRLPLRMAGNYPFGRIDARLVRIGQSRDHRLECMGWKGFAAK
ncbi:MAG: DUF3108 domain-containing protein [Gammaproteobacteria bacterium]|nr:DUF3108 domain-containing protein [Gammaproteobacteria bacterium]